MTFSIQQDETDLVLLLGNRGEANQHSFRQMAVKGVFRRPQTFLTITSDGRETAIYVNGQLAVRSMEFGLSARNLSGKLILANSPRRNNSWSGKLRGLAIYARALTPSEIAQRYEGWRKGRQSPPAFGEKTIGFYTFHEHGGRIVHDASASGIDLFVPERFVVVAQSLLEPPWSEVHTYHSYIRDCVINIEGFVPLGFLLTTYFALVRNMKRPALGAILVGGSLSAIVEMLQAYLPTRFSGCTDIITNTLGTAFGAVLYYRFATSIKKRLSVSAE